MSVYQAATKYFLVEDRIATRAWYGRLDATLNLIYLRCIVVMIRIRTGIDSNFSNSNIFNLISNPLNSSSNSSHISNKRQ